MKCLQTQPITYEVLLKSLLLGTFFTHLCLHGYKVIFEIFQYLFCGPKKFQNVSEKNKKILIHCPQRGLYYNLLVFQVLQDWILDLNFPGFPKLKKENLS